MSVELAAAAASFFEANVLANLLVEPDETWVTPVAAARGPAMVGEILKGGSIAQLSHLV